MISEELIYDEEFNRLSLEAQSLFVRMLARADDCGVIPANEYSLITLTNPPGRVRKNLPEYLTEMLTDRLGIVFEHDGKRFFAFKRDSFDRIQSYIIAKRTKSEYLNLEAETAIDLISKKFQEILGNSSVLGSSPIESNKQRVESIKQKAKETVPQNLESVKTFFAANGAKDCDAANFWDHFESNGWRVGGKSPMKDWQASARKWIRNIPEFRRKPPEPTEQTEEERKAYLEKTYGHVKLR